MENKSWTVVYRNRWTNQTVTAAVFAPTLEEAARQARANAEVNGCKNWRIESIEPHEETLARILIAEFAKEQQGGHFACPRCGKMAMDPESVTRNALSRRADVYVCDTCGMLEGIEDMPENFKLPLSAWAITKKTEAWGMPLQLTFVGRDSWSRPVYKCGGRLYVDVNPREDCQPDICTKQGNSFDGEPCDPLSEGTEVEFIPRRDTW